MEAENVLIIDAEDAEDLLPKIEKSFGIKFDKNELSNIKTFGELCDHITNKIQLESVEGCTSQQAFYKLRNAISTSLNVKNKVLTPQFLLNEILSRKNRRSEIKSIEKNLGFKLFILEPPRWLSLTNGAILIISLISIFFSWKIGLAGIIISLISIILSQNFGNDLIYKTLGEVAEKLARENYLKSRRNPQSVNKNEIEKELKKLFISGLYLESELTKEAKFG